MSSEIPARAFTERAFNTFSSTRPLSGGSSAEPTWLIFPMDVPHAAAFNLAVSVDCPLPNWALKFSGVVVAFGVRQAHLRPAALQTLSFVAVAFGNQLMLCVLRERHRL